MAGQETDRQTRIGFRKVVQTELKAITAVASDAQSKSSELDLSGLWGVSIFIDHARDAAAAFVGAGTEYRVEVSQKYTGNDTWRTIASVVCDITAAVTITTSNLEAIGSTLIECGAVVPTVGDIVFFKNASLDLSEWAKVITVVPATSFTILDGLTNAQAASNYFNKAEVFVLNIYTDNFVRLRVVCNNNNGATNQNIIWRCAAITED